MISVVDPRTGVAGADFPETTAEQTEQLLSSAHASRAMTGVESAESRALALRALASRLQQKATDLTDLCAAETGLSLPRLDGELERTWRQILAFADLIESARQCEPLIEQATAAHPDLRWMLVPRGPVVNYCASNFPFAFGVVGGDTASAFAAGCPVICKANPGHPGTSALLGAEFTAALAQAGLPPGWFGLIQTSSVTVSQSLTRDDRVEAVTFTGSQAVGRALFDIAASRPRPIPVFAEMGSVNPVVITDAALHERCDQIVADLAAAITQHAGQLCTKPGLIFIPDDESGHRFQAALGAAVGASSTGPMLGHRLRDSALAATALLADDPEVAPVVRGSVPRGPALFAPAALFTTTALALISKPQLMEERFGPIALLLTYADRAELLAALKQIPGQLTATIQHSDTDRDEVLEIAEALLPLTGRLIFNGVPTGVSPTAAMHHGGPYPASTDALHTAVGEKAIRRFLRPVVWQNAPSWVLPAPLAG